MHQHNWGNIASDVEMSARRKETLVVTGHFIPARKGGCQSPSMRLEVTSQTLRTPQNTTTHPFEPRLLPSLHLFTATPYSAKFHPSTSKTAQKAPVSHFQNPPSFLTAVSTSKPPTMTSHTSPLPALAVANLFLASGKMMLTILFLGVIFE